MGCALADGLMTSCPDAMNRLLRAHALRAADGLQLAAALVASEHQPGAWQFICLDNRLATAAEREGFT